MAYVCVFFMFLHAIMVYNDNNGKTCAWAALLLIKTNVLESR